MPCSPKAAMRLMAHTTSCWLPQMELVVPKRMSGFTGSRDLCGTAPHILDGATKLAAAVRPDSASAEDTNSRLLILRSVVFTDMGFSSLFAQQIFCAHPAMKWKPPASGGRVRRYGPARLARSQRAGLTPSDLSRVRGRST